MKVTYTKEQIEEAVKNSKSFTEVAKWLGRPKNGFYVGKFTRLADEFGIDISHFDRTVSLVCSECEKPFTVMLHDKEKRKFCSLVCANQKVRGSALPKNEDELYGEKKFRLICFRYHKKECIICGEDKIISVHHFDENHQNDEPKNLIPMCPTHHCYMHSAHRKLIEDKVINYYNNFTGL